MNFQPNDKVVCIDDNFHANWRDYYTETPIKNKVYCVESIHYFEGVPGIVVVGIYPFRLDPRGMPCWMAKRFRKVEHTSEPVEVYAHTKN